MHKFLRNYTVCTVAVSPRLLTNLMLEACKRPTLSNKCFWAMIFVHTVFGEACTKIYGTILFALLQFPPDG